MLSPDEFQDEDGEGHDPVIRQLLERCRALHGIVASRDRRIAELEAGLAALKNIYLWDGK